MAMKIVAATGCPTGIAHTFMAAEAIAEAGKERGLDIKVETHGQVGIENELTPQEIADADGVLVAADIEVQAERFAGKPMVDVGISEAVKNAGKLVDQVIAKVKAQDAEATAKPAEAAADSDDFLNVAAIDTSSSRGFKHGVHVAYKHLMNGVSHMLPFVVGGGILIAVSFLWGIYSADPAHPDQYNAFAAMLKTVGGYSLNLMVPVLSAFIGQSIAKRPGLTIGLTTGMIAFSLGTGFLGGIVSGFLSGYGMLLMAKVFSGLPKSLEGLKAIFIYPLLGTLIFGGIIFLLSTPMAGISTGLQNFLTGFQHANPILLGIIVGAMCGFDLGGPVNKAAYVTGVALLAEGNFYFMAGVSAACIVPPLVTAFAVTFFPKGFNSGERRSGYVNYILGSTHITEGAIPFAASNPVVVLPIYMFSSAIASVLTFLWKIQDPAPHGGFLVLPIVEPWYMWLLAILIGSVVGALLFGTYRMRKAAKDLKLDEGAAATKPVSA